MDWIPEDIPNDFATVAQLAGVSLQPEHICMEVLRAPHVPKRLPPKTMAVYVFALGDDILKVGKAGPNSSARYMSQHYNVNKTKSTLAKSLIEDAERIKLTNADQSEIGIWIKNNVDRVNFLLSAELDTLVLSLLESFLQCRLRPRYEGPKSQRG